MRIRQWTSVPIATEILTDEGRSDPGMVKTIGNTGRRKPATGALFHPQRPPPHGPGALYQHIGLYAYRRAALARFVTLPPSSLEMRENLEQLRALEAGMRIDVSLVGSRPMDVNTPGRSRCGARHARPSRNHSKLLTSRLVSSHVDTQEDRLPGRKTAPTRTWPAAMPFPTTRPSPCATFEDCFTALENGEADLGMIPVENSVAGRVADIHHLLPRSSLHIIGEYFLPIRFQLMALPGAQIGGLKSVQSHIMALGQCRKIIRELGLAPIIGADTAGSARQIAERGDMTVAALAPEMAAEAHGLEILRRDVEDAAPQYHALPHPFARAGARAQQRPAGHHHVHLPGAQRACRALSRRSAASPPMAST